LPASLMPERKLKLRATISKTTNQATDGTPLLFGG
jgi:hypothetical protein